MIIVSKPENVTITKVITNKWKLIVKMTAEGYRVSGANKRVVFGSFTEVIDYIKSYY